jgi:hypothetical protein
VTGEQVEAAFVDQGYTGEQAEVDAAAHGIWLEVVKLPAAKRGNSTTRLHSPGRHGVVRPSARQVWPSGVATKLPSPIRMHARPGCQSGGSAARASARGRS